MDNLNYEIISLKDISIAGAKRYVYNVWVSGQPTVSQLKDIANKVIEKAKRKPFNAVSVAFYDYPEYVTHGYTLGQVVFAPNGKWEEANNVKTAEYKKMSCSYILKEKDWSKQPTKEEANIFLEYKNLYYKGTVHETEVSHIIAQKHKTTAGQINSIMLKKVFWQGDIKEGHNAN